MNFRNPRTVIDKIEDDLAYRLPQSGKQLSAIVLSREQAEKLVEEFRALEERLPELVEIVARVTPWAGSGEQALAWYRAEPIPAFGGRTAESMVKDGKAAAVRNYLDGMASGGFA